MIAISKKPEFTMLNLIPYETTHRKILGTVDVTHKPVKGLIAVGGPLGDTARKTLHGTQKIIASHAGSKQQLHEDSACDWSKFPLGFCLGFHRASDFVVVKGCADLLQSMKLWTSQLLVLVNGLLKE